MPRVLSLALTPVLLVLTACPGDDGSTDDAATPTTGPGPASTTADDPPAATSTSGEPASTSSSSTTALGSTGPDPDDSGTRVMSEHRSTM